MKYWRVSLDGHPFDRVYAVETASKARWIDFKAAVEAGYFRRDGFRRYLKFGVKVRPASEVEYHLLAHGMGYS